jgi:hypothetical protein
MLPLTALGTPVLPVSDHEVRAWQPWTAAVLGALAALDGPLADDPPERLLIHFHPLVAGAAALLTVLREEAVGVLVGREGVVVANGALRVPLVDGRQLTLHGLVCVASHTAPADTWLTALMGLAQATLQGTARWPGLPPILPVSLRRN